MRASRSIRSIHLWLAMSAMFLLACNDDPTGSTGAFEISVSPGTLTLPQGGTGTVTISLTRVGGFAGPVSLGVTGLPAGVTTTITPSELAGNVAAAVIEVAIGATVAGGNYTATVTATGQGTSQVQVQWQLVVVTAGTLEYRFCSESSVPVFAAYQDGTGPWQAVTGTPGATATTFSITLTQPRGGVLFVYQDQAALRSKAALPTRLAVRSGGAPRLMRAAGGYGTEFRFGSAAELAQDAIDYCALTRETGTVFATVAGVPVGQYGIVALGGVTSIYDGGIPNNPLTFEGVPPGVVDVVGMRATPGAAPDRAIVLRSVVVQDGGALPGSLDFGAGAAITPATASVTITGGGTDNLEPYTDLITSHGAGGIWSELISGPSPNRLWAGLPESAMQPGDFHALIVFASPTDGSGALRVAGRYVGLIANQTIAIGPVMPAPVISQVSPGPYPRLRFQGTLPTAYDRGVGIEMTGEDGSGNWLAIYATSAWLGASGNPLAYDLTMPDVTGLTGFPVASRLLEGENTVLVGGIAFTGAGVFEPKPAIGREFKAATKAASVTVP